MTKKQQLEKIWNDCTNNIGGCFLPTMQIAIFVIVALLLFTSCATKTKIEYRDRDVNHYVTKEVHDTLIDKTTDSVYVNVYMKGDTVFKEKYKEKTRWRDKIVIKNDTCWRDSVITEYKETVKEIVKYPNTYWWFLGISIISIIFAFVKVLKWLRIIP
jgi:hypothetical protein